MCARRVGISVEVTRRNLASLTRIRDSFAQLSCRSRFLSLFFFLSTDTNSTMSGAEGGESCEELLNMLHQRMISTGEWSSLLVQLRRMLEESGWEAQLREQAERTELLRTSKVIYLHYAGEARSQDSLHIGAIVDKLGGYAHGRCASTSDVTLSRYIPGVGAN